MAKSKFRGHEIEYINDEWLYSDTKETVKSNYNERPCGNCGKPFTPEGHDGCLGTLKGIMNACCGHGEVKDAYIQFLDGSVVNGKNAISILDILKNHKEK